jgi:hypothetical protein
MGRSPPCRNMHPRVSLWWSVGHETTMDDISIEPSYRVFRLELQDFRTWSAIRPLCHKPVHLYPCLWYPVMLV